MTDFSSSTDPATPCHVPVNGQPAWDLALLYPMQGNWSDLEYLSVTEGTSKLLAGFSVNVTDVLLSAKA